MTIIEKLIAADKNKNMKKEKKIKSQKLTELLGEETFITIRALSGRKINNLNQMMTDKKGNVDVSKAFDANLMYCVEGIVEPSMKDKNLMEAYGMATPKDLAERLFDVEASSIAGKIIELSGLEKDVEEDVKN